MKVYRDLVEDGVLVSKEIFDIAECTYTGKDMGERSITATIEFATPIDFQIGDYIKLPMQNLIRSTNGVNGSIASGSDEAEKFYIYTMPTIKKVARAMSNGKAFEHNVTFQSAQYELSCVQMRDLGNSMNADSVIYTGFDNVTFNGAAHELMERIMMVLKEAYHDSDGNPLWSYEISDTVNEDVNLALERFPISFSGNTVMDALLELNNKETINTTFFINNRKIYVGFKRPYFCRVTDGMSIDTNPSSQLFTFQYGKTSDKGVALQYGGLYDITKTVGREVPITKLFAYGASRNLNRYYCSDRVKGGRYVNRLMLPSFDTDGKTDFIISEDALQRYGVREATKQFEEIYPSIRYATYGDIRQIKYCIKVKASGRSEDIDQSSYPIARIQCYKVVEGEITGVNKLVEAAPPDDLAIYIHAMDKTVKVVLYGGATDEEAIAKQKAHDTHVPTRVYSGAIPGSCFIVHDRGFDEAGTAYENADRSAWFTSLEDLSGFTEKQKEEIKLNQINYTDTFWLTDLYIFQDYEQTYFSRDGYSAWSWARLNNKYSSEKGHVASDSVVVNEIVHVEPITISDTNMTADGIDKRQSTFDIYLRDLGFTINEQNDFGDMVFLQNGTVKVSILDGLLAGQEFEISGSINSTSPSCICAFNDDGTRNEAFFEEPDYTTDGTNPQTPYDAFEKGAIWRIRLNRTNVDEADYANLNLAMPTKEINAKQGDHLVLLDIFMPDIYIHAAENRLLREARKYLEANDNGSISYSVNFDKVRMQQIPNYALQMREGLNLRVVDEDLNIRTKNNGRYIADYRDNKIFSSTESDHNRVWLSANTPIDFTRGKYYTIEFEMYDDSSFDTSATNAFALLKTKNDATIAFNPSYSVNKAYLDNGKIAVTIKFNLPDNFDDSSIYYPSLLLVSEISSNMRMYSHWLSYVFERDFDENTNILNYADFTIDSLTIKITDNSGNNEPIREITATLSEQTNATAWATLMNKVATTAKEGAQNKKALEEVVNTARKNYQALLSLKDSIFDPDGSCDQVFLQVMMQQVGADSMNYQLDNTRSGLGSDGQPTLFNCSCERDSDGYYHFKVYSNDTLRHYVYTQGSQAGNWEIPVGATGVDVQLNGTESYFVCLKCPKNDTVGQWICSTKQYAVNDPEDDTCWFFNWAILTVDSGGVYTLTETRGNAYMYGDNLVCGKISTMAGNSYFDLTHGNFVLGDGTGPALSYINGILTISGSKGDVEKTLEQLGLLQKDVEKAQQDAEEAKNMEIGGTNLVQGTSSGYGWTGFDEYGVEDGIFYCKNINKGNDGAQIYSPKNIVLSANSDYTISFEMKASSDIRRVQFYFINYLNSSSFESIYYTEIANKDVSTEWKKYKFNFKPTKNITSGCLRFDNDGLAGSTGNTELWLRRIKLEKGTKATDWTPAPEDYMNAIAESEANVNKELAASVVEINGGIEALQKQVDGEVSSYFYDTAPVGTDETILTNKEPFSEWAKNYTLSNGVYVLKENARNEFINHIGDTYTNMEEYKEDSNGNTTTPLAGLAWRWCDATTVSPLPKKYITIRYTDSKGNSITKQLHWHKIADSDAVKALQEAAKAQATADGKSTIFSLTGSNKPTNYQKGDMWILQSDTIHTAGKKGDILNANADSATYVASHWTKEVSYIDESVAQQQAQQALDGLELGGENLVLESKGDSNKNIRANNTSTSAEFQYSCKPTKSDTYGDELQISLTCSTQGKYYPDSYSYTTCIWVQCKKETIKGKKYTISFDARLLPTSGSDNCTVYFRAAGTGYSTTQMGKAVIDKTKKRYSITVDSNAESDTNTYSYFTLFLSRTTTIYISNVKVEQGNKATGWSPAPEDVDSKANAIKAIADEANEKAIESNAQLANMSDDSILTPQEKGSVADEWACIQKEYTQNESNKESVWGSSTFAEWTDYKNAYNILQTYIGTLALDDRTTNTPIGKSTFQTNFANYYSANVAFLNALSKKVAELEVAAMEIGVRNLWAKKYMMDWNDTYSGIATKGTDDYGDYTEIYEGRLYTHIGGGGEYKDILQGRVSFESEKQYILQVKWRNLQKTIPDGSVGYGLYLMFKYSDGTRSSSIICLSNHIIPTTSTLVSTKGKTVTGVSCTYGTSINTRIYEIQLVQATKQPNDWLVAPEDVDNAVLEAKESAELANAQLDAIDNDNVIAISERAALETQLEQIQSEYNEITNDMNRYSIDTTNYEKAADKAIEALQYHCGKVYDGTNTAPINADKSITIVAGTSVGYGYGNISAYYTARQTALESIAAAVKASAEQYADNAANDAVSNLEVGGTNLLDNSKPIRLGDWGGDGATVTFDESTNSIKGIPSGNYPRIKNTSVKNIGFIAGKYYTLSMDVKANAVATRSVYIGNNSSSVVALSFGAFSVSTSWNRIKLTALCQDHNAYVAAFGMYIYCGTTNAKDNTEFLQIRNIKLEEGKLATSWSPSVADTEAEIRAAESKAEALGYLTEVLEDSENTTDITGGLVMTNVLMLKDLANAGGSVGAGMSGISADNILMWGGGTYEDAVHAKDNNFEKLNGSEITTLLKKDGTGKIGIFKISDTQAVVDVPNQGKVIIDASTANGGIFIYDNNNKQKVVLSPKTISDSGYMPPSAASWSQTSASVSGKTATQGYNTYGTYKTINLGSRKTFSTAGTLQRFSVNLNFSNIKCYVQSSPTTSVTDFTLRFAVKLISSGGTEYYTSGYSTLKNVTSGTITLAIDTTYLPAGTYRISLYIAHMGNYSSSTHECSFSVSYSWSSIFAPTYESKTVICADGIISAYDIAKYFMVQNTSNGQKIYAKGLSATKPSTSGTGELYVSNKDNDGLVKTLVTAMTKIKECLATAKYEGSNAVAQDHATASLDAVINDLNGISIVANS